jgi:hypothetical protein
MKTINNNIDIFTTYKAAKKAFNKTDYGHLLEATQPSHVRGMTYNWFVDRSKTAIKHWEKLYKLLEEK